MISGKDQHILWIIALHILQVLIDRIRSTGIPFTVGEKSVVPANVSVGKNSVVFGITTADDYPEDVYKRQIISLPSTLVPRNS